MRCLIISDGHGNLEMLDKLDEEFKKADCVLFGGDFAKFGETETGLPFLQRLCKKHEKIFAVLGNCDEPEFIEQLENSDISVVNSIVYSDGLAFIGSSGGSKFTGTTPFERDDEELAFDLHLAKEPDENGTLPSWDNLVAIMHNPPKDTKCDVVGDGIHVGSAALKEWIENVKPILVVTGHIHESRGVDKIGETVVVNPGALCEGNYAVAEISRDGDIWKVANTELKAL
ncbi:MAG: metallophosphoesterase family protein [Treponemataceae bacterium]|nr:metallophosphoesterase family protein [Treponemataceae bacterium]